MPLLMGCTNPSPIEEETTIHNDILYDPLSQKVVLDMRVVGTKCLKVSSTQYKAPNGSGKAKTDKKNEIDDSKHV